MRIILFLFLILIQFRVFSQDTAKYEQLYKLYIDNHTDSVSDDYKKYFETDLEFYAIIKNIDTVLIDRTDTLFINKSFKLEPSIIVLDIGPFCVAETITKSENGQEKIFDQTIAFYYTDKRISTVYFFLNDEE